jgi:hypothetical protein
VRRSDSRTDERSESATIPQSLLAVNSAGNFFGIGADLAILETIVAVIPVVCGKFPADAEQGVLSRGQGTFLAWAAIFFGR